MGYIKHKIEFSKIIKKKGSTFVNNSNVNSWQEKRGKGFRKCIISTLKYISYNVAMDSL